MVAARWVAWSGSVLLLACAPADPNRTLRTDSPGFYDAASGSFRLTLDTGAVLAFAYGPRGLKAVSGDWDGDDRDSVGLYSAERGTFLLTDFNAANIAARHVGTGWAGPWLQPIAGDWDGDGRDGVGVFDPASARVLLIELAPRLTRREVELVSGLQPALAVAGDWDGDARDEIGLYYPSDGRFLLSASSGEAVLIEGAPRLGVPATADLDGDGRSEPIVYDRAKGVVWARSRSGAFVASHRLGASPAMPIFGRWALSSAPVAPAGSP